MSGNNLLSIKFSHRWTVSLALIQILTDALRNSLRCKKDF